jgi:hypothetical protein
VCGLAGHGGVSAKLLTPGDLYAGTKEHMKGTGTRDYYRLKVVWFDRSWILLGEIPAAIYNYNLPFNIFLIV